MAEGRGKKGNDARKEETTYRGEIEKEERGNVDMSSEETGEGSRSATVRRGRERENGLSDAERQLREEEGGGARGGGGREDETKDNDFLYNLLGRRIRTREHHHHHHHHRHDDGHHSSSSNMNEHGVGEESDLSLTPPASTSRAMTDREPSPPSSSCAATAGTSRAVRERRRNNNI